MTKKQRDAIYENLFREGVMVAEKICKRTQGRIHPDVTGIPNLLVIKGKIISVIQAVIVKSFSSLPIFDLPWLGQATIRLETLLLDPHQRRY